MPSVLDQIRKLDEQKAALLQTAKEEALAQANAAIATLRELGFNYRVVESSEYRGGDGGVPSPRTGGRRTGIRELVLHRVQNTPNGVTASQVILMLAANDDAAKTSVRNALAALKRSGAVTLADGVYKAK